MKLFAAFLGMTVLVLVTGPPSRALAAEMHCGPAPLVLKALKDNAAEVPAFSGASIGGGQLIMTVSATGSWTMFVITGANLCPVAAGEAIKPDADGKPATKAPMALPGLQPHDLILIAR